jgi:hypothetical protein
MAIKLGFETNKCIEKEYGHFRLEKDPVQKLHHGKASWKVMGVVLRKGYKE